MTDDAKTPRCEMRRDCKAAVTHIDEKGFVYCTKHGEARKNYLECRRLRPHELVLIKTGEQLERY